MPTGREITKVPTKALLRTRLTSMANSTMFPLIPRYPDPAAGPVRPDSTGYVVTSKTSISGDGSRYGIDTEMYISVDKDTKAAAYALKGLDGQPDPRYGCKANPPIEDGMEGLSPCSTADEGPDGTEKWGRHAEDAVPWRSWKEVKQLPKQYQILPSTSLKPLVLLSQSYQLHGPFRKVGVEPELKGRLTAGSDSENDAPHYAHARRRSLHLSLAPFFGLVHSVMSRLPLRVLLRRGSPVRNSLPPRQSRNAIPIPGSYSNAPEPIPKAKPHPGPIRALTTTLAPRRGGTFKLTHGAMIFRLSLFALIAYNLYQRLFQGDRTTSLLSSLILVQKLNAQYPVHALNDFDDIKAYFYELLRVVPVPGESDVDELIQFIEKAIDKASRLEEAGDIGASTSDPTGSPRPVERDEQPRTYRSRLLDLSEFLVLSYISTPVSLATIRAIMRAYAENVHGLLEYELNQKSCDECAQAVVTGLHFAVFSLKIAGHRLNMGPGTYIPGGSIDKPHILLHTQCSFYSGEYMANGMQPDARIPICTRRVISSLALSTGSSSWRWRAITVELNNAMAPSVADVQQAPQPTPIEVAKEAAKQAAHFVVPHDESYSYSKYRPFQEAFDKEPALQYFDHVDAGSRADPAKPHLLTKDTKLHHLSPYLGTEVRGVQLSQLSNEGLDELALFVAERKVVGFRDQDLKDVSPEKQLEFASHFGPPHVHPIAVNVEGYPAIAVVYRDEERPGFTDHLVQTQINHTNWHSDVSYEKQPPGTTFFYILDGPEVGGDTLFLSQVEAYKRLSPAFQNFLLGLKAIHTAVPQAEGATKRGLPVRRDPVETEHPIVRVHPVTGEKALFINPGFTSRVVGFKKEESDALLQFLFDHITKGADFQVRLSYQPGSVVIWDNRVTAHSAIPDFNRKLRRHHIRLTPQAEKPIAATEV
ncbi:hypothetical protein NMY22_g5166 [Coprinellus aureogranulatus]|nr:hypothetical protein NMY22_g5166 [Coprinellus aureogranulatus]